MPDFSVSTAFTAQDKITTAFRKMGRGAGMFENKATKSFRNVSRAGARTGSIIKGILGAQVIGRGVRLLTQGLRTATTEFIAFDQTIVGATARFKDLELGSAEAAKTMELLKNTAREVGAVTQFTATEAAAGLNFFARAGFTSTEAMAALKTQVDLATVAELDLARTSDITSDLLGALGLNAADSATKIENLEKLSNSLGLASNLANVTLEDMFETLKVAAPIATAAGEKMNPLIGITAALGGAGIKGSQAATALKNAYINLATNAPAVESALASIGLAQSQFVDQETGTLDMVKAMQLMGDATKGLGNVDQLAIFSEVFGKRAVAGAVNISKSLSEIENITRILDSDKRISAIADEIRTGLGMQVKILNSSMIELGFKFIDAFKDKGAKALEILISAVQNFNVQPIVNGVNFIIDIFKKLLPHVKPIIDTLILVASDWIDMFKGTEIFSTIFKEIGLILDILGIAFQTMWAIAKPILKLWLFFLEPIFKIIDLILTGIGKVTDFFASGQNKLGGSQADFEAAGRARATGTEAPNRREAPNQAAVQRVENRFQGRLDISTAPGINATVQGQSGSSRDFDLRLLGQN